MKTTKYFAVTDNNGLVSQELSATTEADAILEVKAAIADRSATAWLDDNQTALEDACIASDDGHSCDGLSYDAALAVCAETGAVFVWGEPSNDKWNIWSVDVDE